MGVFLAPIYTRVLSTEQYGLLDLATTVSAVLMILAESQMVSGFMRSYYEAKEKNDRAALAGTILIYYLVSNALLVLVVWGFQGLLTTHVAGFDRQILVPVLVGLLPQQITGLALSTLRMERRARTFLLISVGQVSLAAVLGIVAVVPMQAGAVGILWGLAVARLVFALVSLVLILRILHVRPSVRYLRKLACYSIPIVPAVLGAWAHASMGRFFIVGSLSLSALGVFSIASKIAGIVFLFTFSFRQVWDPYAVKLYGQNDSEPLFVKVAELYAFLMFGVLVLVTSLSPVILRILAPKEYWSAAPFITILGLGYILNEWAVVFASGNNWERKTYCNMYGNLLALATGIALLWWGTSKYGLVLVTGSFVIASLIKSMVVLYTAQCNHRIPFSMLGVCSAIVVFLLYSLLSYGLAEYASLSLWLLIPVYFLIGSLFMLAMWFIILRNESKAWIASLWSDSLQQRKSFFRP